MRRVWKIIGWILVIYILYAIIRSPAQAADVVRGIFEILANGVRSIATFFDSLLFRR
jgi:hypothetical protein